MKAKVLIATALFTFVAFGAKAATNEPPVQVATNETPVQVAIGKVLLAGTQEAVKWITVHGRVGAGTGGTFDDLAHKKVRGVSVVAVDLLDPARGWNVAPVLTTMPTDAHTFVGLGAELSLRLPKIRGVSETKVAMLDGLDQWWAALGVWAEVDGIVALSLSDKNCGAYVSLTRRF
jgi:hypothetical protein